MAWQPNGFSNQNQMLNFKQRTMKLNNKLRFLFTFIAIITVMASCTEDVNVAPENDQEQVEISAKAQEQIDNIFALWEENFGSNADLQPIGFEKPQVISSEEDKNEIVGRLASPETHYAYYDGENLSSLKVFKLESVDNGRQIADNARKTANELVAEGQSYVNFKWKYKGEEFTTPFVYNEEGFVYEPIAASIAIKKEGVDADARTSYIHWFDLQWIWGGKRGHVRISHTTNCSGSRMTGHSGWSDAYMQIGSAQADIITNGSTYSKSCTSWGYAWGTSPISASVSTNWGASGNYNGVSWNGAVNASLSGTLGSSGKASGFHVMTCY